MGCGSSVNSQVQTTQNVVTLRVTLKISDHPNLFDPLTRTINSKTPEKLYLLFFDLQKTHEMIPKQDQTLKGQEQPYEFQFRQHDVIRCQLCYNDQITQQQGESNQLSIVIGEGAFTIKENSQIETILFYEGKKTAKLKIEATGISALPTQEEQNNDSRKVLFFAKSLIHNNYKSLIYNQKSLNNNVLMLTLRYGDDTQNIIKQILLSQENSIKIDEWVCFKLKNKQTPVYIEIWEQQKLGADTFIGQGYCPIQGEQTITLINNGDEVGQIQIFLFVPKQSDISETKPNDQSLEVRYSKNEQLKYQEIYNGQFSDNEAKNQYTGQGKLTIGNSLYEGQFQAGNRQGQGKLSFNNIQYYDGRWKDNTLDGNGEWQFGPNDKKRGIWSNGNRINWRDDEQNAIYSGRTVSAGFMLKSQNQLFTMFFSNEGHLYIIHNQTKQAVFAISKFSRQLLEKPFTLEFDNNGVLNLKDRKGSYYKANTSDKPTESTLALFDDGRLVIQDTATLDIIWESQSLF